MKFIFLDVDGVLNDENTKEYEPNGAIGVDNNKVALLSKIVEKTGAKVVLTSSWKRNFDRHREGKFNLDNPDESAKYLVNKLTRNNVFLFDTTFKGDGRKRGKYVLEYLKKFKNVESYVILDDEYFDFMIYDETREHLVLTSDAKQGVFDCYIHTGLERKHVEMAIEILNGRCV